MPHVGNKDFPYTPKGEKAATKYSAAHGYRIKRKSSAKPNPSAPLGEGGRFAAVEAKAAAGGAKNPAAVAASVGRKKYGKGKFQAMAARGR